MANTGRRVVGGLGGGLLLASVLLPLFARGSLMEDSLETLSMLAVSPWVGIAAIVFGLAGLALAVSRNPGWLWMPSIGALACLALALTVFRPQDYGLSVGIWTFLGSLVLTTISAALRESTRGAPGPNSRSQH